MVLPGSRFHGRPWRFWSFWLFLCSSAVPELSSATNGLGRRIMTREDLKSTIDVFGQADVESYGQLLFDIQRYQLIVGARDYLFRLSLEGLQKLEEAHWPADEESVTTCLLKGKSQDDCRNYIKVLLHHSGKLFSCGTNAFLPECSWREINSVKSVREWTEGAAKCPCDPRANGTALVSSGGDYYVASTIDFTGQDPVIYKIMGKAPLLRTLQFDPKWLSNPSFIGAYEIEDFIYFFFREAAVEYINCGKATYSRVARVCKNDRGGQFLLKDKFTTFLKARLNCSIPGNYPFYYNEIQGVHFLEREDVFYATFTTSENSIYGSAVCGFNMSAVRRSFEGPFKYQSNPKFAWERKVSSHRHFQCETPGDAENVLDSEKYQLMNDAVQPMTSQPFFKLELERLSHIVVDAVQTKTSDGVHVMFVASVEGLVLKLVSLPESRGTCVVERIQLFPDGSGDSIKVMKLLKDTNSLYIGTEESVLRLPVHRCDRHKTKGECLDAMDPYCGWNEYQLACTAAPNRNPKSLFWHQEEITCSESSVPIDGRWSSWGPWQECSQVGRGAPGDRCRCQQRRCDNPPPANGGRGCKGNALHVTNCTQNGQWTEWSTWSSCSSACGLAVKSRRRSCSNPAPAFGGQICIGPEKDEIFCTSNPPCPASSSSAVDGHWSAWSTWDECSAPCGGGLQVRRRRCNSPPPQHGGGDCRGCGQEFRPCNAQLCPERRKSSHWTPFFRLNGTREGHFEQRLRFSCRANVADESLLRLGPLKREERFCREGARACSDAAFSSVDGGWSSWSAWSSCSGSCGVQFRERRCDSPPPSGAGADCHGVSRTNRVCNVEPCAGVHEAWEAWSAWSSCDDSREQHRRRRCRFSLSDAVHCTGPSGESRMCVAQQTGDPSGSQSGPAEDGVRAEHVVGAFVTGLMVGGALSACAIYLYAKRRRNEGPPQTAVRLVPVRPDTYADCQSDWKIGGPDKEPQRIPLREATIKRNGSLRAQIQSDHNF